MVASHLEEVLELCTKIADMNKTVNLVHEVEHFIRKNRRKITKETKIARSKVRRTFGKLESRIIDMLISAVISSAWFSPFKTYKFSGEQDGVNT